MSWKRIQTGNIDFTFIVTLTRDWHGRKLDTAHLLGMINIQTEFHQIQMTEAVDMARTRIQTAKIDFTFIVTLTLIRHGRKLYTAHRLSMMNIQTEFH